VCSAAGRRNDNLNPVDLPFERGIAYEQLRSNAISANFTGGALHIP
jgi:hypothetical protein